MMNSFRRQLYSFYRKNGRSLPWRPPVLPIVRGVVDPYRIMVSEIMLQQTQVPRVIVKYPEFLKQFPTVRALAAASLKDVLRVWQGMGYNRRALYLQRAAAAIVSEHGGRVPRSIDALKALPGIGYNTACSIMAFAFNEPVVFIETNIRSVFIHHFFEGRAGIRDEEILSILTKTLDRNNPRQFYAALMDYGTMLKKAEGNPSRRSAHHVKQSRFEGSDRQLRGTVIATLAGAVGAMSRTRLRKVCRGVEHDRFERVVDSLVRDGLVATRGDNLFLQGDKT